MGRPKKIGDLRVKKCVSVEEHIYQDALAITKISGDKISHLFENMLINYISDNQEDKQ